MRILYFSRDYGSVSTTFIRNEVAYFSSVHECLYLCQRNFTEGESPAFAKVVPFKENRVKWLLRKLRWRFDFRSASYSSKVKRIVEEFRPDIIHCHFGAETFMLLDNIDYHTYRVFIHFHGYDASQALRNGPYVKRLAEQLRQPDVFPISCNRFFAERLSRVLNIPENRFIILHYGIDTELFRRKELLVEGSGKVFLQISSLVPKKGHIYTLKAFAVFLRRTGRKDCRLIIAGDGPERRKLERVAVGLNLVDTVQFTGSVTPARAVELLQHADVFVHHSVTAANGDMEGMPNSLIEAMSMKLPVVSTIHSGIPELVEEGVNGLLVRERDIEDYSMKMEQALGMGLLEHNRLKVEKFYSVTLHNETLHGLYRSVITAD